MKNAEFYFESAQISLDREIILSDSVGINQGQKDATRINEVVFIEFRSLFKAESQI